MPEGVERIPLKAVHTNHVPMIAPAATLKGVDCKRIGLDPQRCFANAEKLTPVLASVRNKVMDVFKPHPPVQIHDPDHMIYSGGFFSQGRPGLMDKIRSARPDMLASTHWPFKDQRLQEMLFRYRARNFPDSLSTEEHQQWQEQRLARLNAPADTRQLSIKAFGTEISAAREAYSGDGRAQKILDQLESWGNEICQFLKSCRS